MIGRPQFEIFYSIIVSNPVFMVNRFCLSQRSSKMTLHNPNVLGLFFLPNS